MSLIDGKIPNSCSWKTLDSLLVSVSCIAFHCEGRGVTAIRGVTSDSKQRSGCQVAAGDGDDDCSFSSQSLSLSVEYYVYAVLDARCSLAVGCWRWHLPSVSAVCCPRAESSGERPLQPRESHLLPTPRCLLQLDLSHVSVCVCVCAPVH